MIIKKCICLYMSVLLFSVSGMQPEDNPDRVGWRSWVQDAKTVQIRSLFKLLDDKFSIHDATTIADIKSRLRDREGIPTNQQVIQARYTDLPTFWRYSYSEQLDDECYVKDVMHCYNSNCLIMCLALQQQQTHANELDQS